METNSAFIQQIGMPRFRGFNLLQKFRHDNAGKTVIFERPNMPYPEEDFAMIRELGFDYVRLPLDYLCWAGGELGREMDEATMKDIDQAVEFGRQYGIHVCLNFHRAPGYCINPPAERKNLFKDNESLEVFCHHWRMFAHRYRQIPSEWLSFNLINEPQNILRPEFMTRLDFLRVMQAGIDAIRGEDPQRPIVVDGLAIGKHPLPELVGQSGIWQGCRGYWPLNITHNTADWVSCEGGWVEPVWPGPAEGGQVWDAEVLSRHYGEWVDLARTGTGIFCGECGCFNQTPHPVVLAWFEDFLKILTRHRIGYALWNFKGPFGILNSGRRDVAYEDFHGHQLDRKLLEVLQRF